MSRYIFTLRQISFTVALLSVFCGMPSALAGNGDWEIRIDCSDAYAAPGGNWNTITDTNRNSTTYNLVEYNTAAVTGAYIASSWSGVGTSYGWQGDGVDWVHANAGHDTFSQDFGPAGFTIGGLTAEGKYCIQIVSGFNDPDSGSSIKIQNNYADRNYNGGASAAELAAWDELAAYNQHDWLIWDSVTASAAGSISVSVSIASGYDWADVNAISITQIPEPASILLVAMGAAGMVGLRRKPTMNGLH